MVNLKQLAHLVVLDDERHFARAAERVHLSQPAFSRSIKAIEDELGMRLFDRETGPIKPTPAGAFIIERARRLLFDARGLQRDAALYRDSELGNTAFGAGSFMAVTLMPDVLIALRRQYPGVSVRLETNHWQHLLQSLLAEDIEFFVAELRDLPADPLLQITPLGRLSAHLYVRSGHPLAGRPCSFAQAWEFGLATIKLPGHHKALCARLLGLPAGQAPVPALECADPELLRALALATDSVISAADITMRDPVLAGQFVQLEVTDLPAVYAEMGLATLLHRTPSPMARRAMACVQEVARKVAAT
ncbi:LysR family transcriptional regulator [Roseateles sp. P5_E7]